MNHTNESYCIFLPPVLCLCIQKKIDYAPYPRSYKQCFTLIIFTVTLSPNIFRFWSFNYRPLILVLLEIHEGNLLFFPYQVYLSIRRLLHIIQIIRRVLSGPGETADDKGPVHASACLSDQTETGCYNGEAGQKQDAAQWGGGEATLGGGWLIAISWKLCISQRKNPFGAVWQIWGTF